MKTVNAVRSSIFASDERGLFFESLYERAFPGVARFISEHKGSFQDAKDIFQDALVIYYEKTRENAVTITTSAEAYILGIAKHLWYRKFEKSGATLSLDLFESSFSIPEEKTGTVAEASLLALLEQTGKKCLELLRSFYYDQYSTNKIREIFGYTSEHSATVQKFKCLEKIRTHVKQNQMQYEDFLEEY